jgi:Ca-activated chloride channel family protein
MKFGAPEFIKWLLLIIPLTGLIIFMHRQRAMRLARLISSNVWETVIPGRRKKHGHRRTVLRILALLCIGLALTRPQWGSRWEEVKQRGLDIIVVLDTSKSMLAEDIKPNRLKQAQWAVRNFVKQLKGDRIGLIAFSGSSFLQCPVTVDYAAFTMMLDDLYAGIIPRGGTAIEQALKTAADSFDAKSEADRAVILITDGDDHEGDPARMAEQFRKENIKLFCIGVGTLSGELIPSNEGYMKDSQGRVVKSSLNEGLLEKLARETGGFYVRSAPGDFGLDRIYKLGISDLQRDEQESRLAKVYEERFVWFAAAALLFLLAEGLFRPASLLVFLLFFPTQKTEAAGWEKAYRKGDYTNALLAVDQLAEKFPDIGNYNRGNVLYRQKDFQGSEKAYSSAAQTENNELKQKALYNRGTALLAGTTQQQDPAQMDAKINATTQAIDLFEQALSLKPDDLDAKQNLERALNLRITIPRNLIEEASALVEKGQGKAAKTNCEKAKNILSSIAADYAMESQSLMAKADKILRRLDQALIDTRKDLKNAQLKIEEFQYETAAKLVQNMTLERKLAFDQDSELAKSFEDFQKKNEDVLKIFHAEADKP